MPPARGTSRSDRVRSGTTRCLGRLEVEITVDDPKAYTRPWTVSMPQEITLDTELVDEFCLENEKSSQHMRDAK